jgi:BCCT family betaine/carnitine transporter
MKSASINYHVLLFPLCIVVFLAGLIFFFPQRAQMIIGSLNDIFVNRLGFFYILTGLIVLSGCIFFSCTKYGNIKLGNIDKPKYSNFKWGSMVFTSTMAADILYWSLIEWVYYYQANPTGALYLSDAEHQIVASTYPLFHWGPIPWAFYILPATAYAYMFFVKGAVRQTLSEACRPVLRDRADRLFGKLIDIISIVGLLGGTATTFALATPLITDAVNKLLGISYGKGLTVIILLLIGFTFTIAVLLGMKAITKLAIICVLLFLFLFTFVFVLGPTKFIIESGIAGTGNMLQNFISMATWTDPLRLTGDGRSGFPQQWTIFYWAYWIAWFVATPFFIAKISEGRRIRELIGGAFFYGIAGTFTSFIVFGNFGLYQQVTGKVDTVHMLEQGIPPSKIILAFFDQLPLTNIALVLLILAMIAFYASTFDAITLIVAGFCRKKLFYDQYPEKKLRVFWAGVFIILPIVLIWSESTLTMLQTISIISAFPLAIIMLIIIFGFYKELKKHPVGDGHE